MLAALAVGLAWWVHGLRERVVLLRAMLAGANQGMALLDSKDRLILWNPRLEQLRGVPCGVLRHGLSFAEFLQTAKSRCSCGEVPEVGEQGFWHCDLQPGQQLSMEIELSGGEILQLNASRLEHGETLLTYADVGPIKQSQLAFRDLSTRLAATLDNVLDGIITINDRGIIDSFSVGAEQLFGYSAPEVIGQNIKLLMPAGLAAHHDGYLDTYRRTGVKRIMRTRRQVEARRKNGQLLPIELGISEMRVGGRRQFIGIVRDITERSRVDRMHQEFVATVSHELRTPLTSIIGALRLLQAQRELELPPSIKRLVEIADHNGQCLQRLVNDILDAVKSGIDVLELSLEPQSIGAVIARTIDANVAYAARSDVQLVYHPDVLDAVARIDASRLQQVLTNLLSNAVNYSPGGQRVEVHLKRNGRFAVVEITDHGPGIPPEFRPHIFQKFSRADSSDARHKGGTGLGLYIARTLVDRMGGLIDYETELGRGTTFRICLPLERGMTTTTAERTAVQQLSA
jgi:PAS domain S-box-containing protein